VKEKSQIKWYIVQKTSNVALASVRGLLYHIEYIYKKIRVSKILETWKSNVR
jgi:hypothetical protein